MGGEKTRDTGERKGETGEVEEREDRRYEKRIGRGKGERYLKKRREAKGKEKEIEE